MTSRTPKDGATSYTQTFDVENRLTDVAGGGETTGFAYDYSGQRTQTTYDDGKKTFYPFPTYELTVVPESCKSCTDDYETRTSLYFLAGQTIATRHESTPAQAGDDLYYFHTDHLGSTSALSDESGVYVTDSIARHLPFGEYRSEPTADLTERGFTGHHENRYIKLVYMNARWYDGSIGRFLSADSIVPDPADPQSHNRYSYVVNNPLRLTDPSGHKYYEPACDCLVKTRETTLETPETLDRAFVTNSDGDRIGNLADGSRIGSADAPNVDAVAIGKSVSFDLPGISGTFGTEIVGNFASGEISIFAYGGVGLSIPVGAGANGAVYVSAISNLPTNSEYRGPYAIFDGTAAVGVGGFTGGMFGVPLNPISEGWGFEDGGRGVFVGYAYGANISGSVNLVWYEELITINFKTGQVRVNSLLIDPLAKPGYFIMDISDLEGLDLDGIQWEGRNEAQ